jgi:hypothetical protein
MRPCLQIEYGENRQKINFLRLQAWRSRHRQGRPHPLPLVVSRGSSNSSSSGGSRGGGKPWEEGGREEEAPTQTQPLRKLPSPTRSTSSMSRSEFKEIFDEARSRLRSSSASVPSSSSSSSSSSSASSSSSSSSNFQPSHPWVTANVSSTPLAQRPLSRTSSPNGEVSLASANGREI